MRASDPALLRAPYINRSGEIAEPHLRRSIRRTMPRIAGNGTKR